MTVPYTFANRTDTIPLAELDANFAAADSVVWGTVTGNLSDQVDLQAALNSKDAAGAAAAAQAASTPIAHATDTANPHTVTKTQVGLGNVDNTSDVNKPVSTAQQTALNLKANAADVSNVDNTSDATKNAATAALTNKTILAATNTVEATSAPNGSAFGFRNKIINGGMLVQQRPLATVSASTQYTADRWQVYLSGATGISATCTAAATSVAFPSGYTLSLQGSWTSGTAVFYTNLEGVDCRSLSGKTVTVSAYIYHNLGSTVSFTVGIHKANSLDNFSTVTQIGSNVVTGVPDSAATRIQATFAIPDPDGDNGIAVWITTASPVTASSKQIYLSCVQLEEGSIATPFEQRPYGLELSLCQRYYQLLNASSIGAAFTNMGITAKYPVRMRTTPTPTRIGNWQSGGETGTLAAVAGVDEIFLSNPTASATAVGGQYTLSAEL